MFMFQQNRQVSLVTISDNIEADITDKKRIVIVMARSHPGEPLSSFVIQGISILKFDIL